VRISSGDGTLRLVRRLSGGRVSRTGLRVTSAFCRRLGGDPPAPETVTCSVWLRCRPMVGRVLLVECRHVSLSRPTTVARFLLTVHRMCAEVHLAQDPSASADSFPDNIRRLLLFHHHSAKEAAEFIGVSPHAVSAWITGKRRPSSHFLIQVARLYDFDTRALVYGDDVAFARELARPERIAWAAGEISLQRKLAAGEEVSEVDTAHRGIEPVFGDVEVLPKDWDHRLEDPGV
jgi:transcriptional regulator with XRE-family HTH domain